MKQKEVAKAVDLRIKYMKIVGDFSGAPNTIVDSLMSKIHNNAKLLLQFDPVCKENNREFQEALIEMTSDSVIMSDFISNVKIAPMTEEIIKTPIVPKLPVSCGLVSDGMLKENERFKLKLDQKQEIERLSHGDPATTNALTRIIVKFERPDIIKSMTDMQLLGRPFSLGFINKICGFSIYKMDSVIKAYKLGEISYHSIKHEATFNNGKMFDKRVIFDNF